MQQKDLELLRDLMEKQLEVVNQMLSNSTETVIPMKRVMPTEVEMPSIPIEDLEVMVTRYIHDVGVPAHLKGYQYLREAIIMLVEEPEMLSAITKALYPAIARKCKTTPSRVEKAIRNAIEMAWSRGSIETLNNLFGCTISTRKDRPTNSEFMALIADKIQMERKNYAC